VNVCSRCGTVTAAVQLDRRPILCDLCRPAWEKERNARRARRRRGKAAG
jgi:hypothetical protein